MRVSAKVIGAMKGALLMGAVTSAVAMTGCGGGSLPAKQTTLVAQPQPIVAVNNPPQNPPQPQPDPDPPVIEPDIAVACGRG